MPSAWIERRASPASVRYRVRFRVGGRESVPHYGGSFGTKREADTRRAWVLDEHERRVLVTAARAKTRRPRWVEVPDVLFDAMVDLVPRQDRGDLTGQVFAGFGADRFRTAMTRACKASGTPHVHPHDLRHRRATLWHLGGVPPAQAAGWLGHSAQEHLRTYAHVMLDRTELDYGTLIISDERMPA